MLKLSSSDNSRVLDSWNALVTKINTLSLTTFQCNMQPYIDKLNKNAISISSEETYNCFLQKVITLDYTCMYVHVHACVCVCVCARAHARACVRVCVCAYVCVCACACMRTHHTHVCACVHTHVYVCVLCV